MKRRFLVIQVLEDKQERRWEETARNYRTAWRRISEHCTYLDRTRSIIIHEITDRQSS